MSQRKKTEKEMDQLRQLLAENPRALPESVPAELQDAIEAAQIQLDAARREHAVVHRKAASVRARVRRKSDPVFAAVPRPKGAGGGTL